jgi:hypothetical protein
MSGAARVRKLASEILGKVTITMLTLGGESSIKVEVSAGITKEDLLLLLERVTEQCRGGQ